MYFALTIVIFWISTLTDSRELFIIHIIIAMKYILYSRQNCLSNQQNIMNFFTGIVPEISTKLLGGHDATSGQFPYHVSLQYTFGSVEEGQHICGGSILNEYWILTAHHCLGSDLISEGSLVKAGRYNITAEHEDGEQIAVVEKIFKHEFYWK